MTESKTKIKNTKIIKIDRDNVDTEALKECALAIKNGGLVCFPTETVYGLGANAFDNDAVREIFAAKGRPQDNPLIVHISDYGMIPDIANLTEHEAERLYALGRKYWPGPMTQIVGKSDRIPEAVSCGLKTVGIRYPSHPIAQKLIELSGVPIAAPSANLSGKPSPSNAEHVIMDMMGRVDYIIDGGPCDVGVESTVIDLSGENPVILRPGAITQDDIAKVAGSCGLYNWHVEGGNDLKSPKSPGMKYTHYSPKADVIIYSDASGVFGEKFALYIRQKFDKIKGLGGVPGAMVSDEVAERLSDLKNVIPIGRRNDSLAQANNLFRALREFDELGVTDVIAEEFPENGVGNAVMNRLFRSAGGRIVKIEEQ